MSKIKTLVLDNYDSFTYNLVHYLNELGVELEVFRNDQISLEAVNQYDNILLSPGPGVPNEAGIMPALIKEFGAHKRILGVCLGHQAIAEAYGAKIYNMEKVLHGEMGKLNVIQNDRLFTHLPSQYDICHYHSWSINKAHLGEELEVTAIDEIGQIMAISHKEYDVKGVQFHPESIMTEHGHALLKNWIKN
jgi:anthranilate synthase component II